MEFEILKFPSFEVLSDPFQQLLDDCHEMLYKHSCGPFWMNHQVSDNNGEGGRVHRNGVTFWEISLFGVSLRVSLKDQYHTHIKIMNLKQALSSVLQN